MNKVKALVLFGFMLLALRVAAQNSPAQAYHEPFRPQLHFSPKAHWMNDPNGMVYYNQTYHLFFQYYPGDIVWGPMHWGHAVSTDLVHWKELPIALYPDSLGYIFSGSAVVDYKNTSGFGKNGKIPLVAIFTHHDPKGEKGWKNDFQNESLAYSLDNGNTWTKYSGNPVLKNPGLRDFRDPKVMWYESEGKWIMTLATFNHITFYSSSDLKSWKKESEFGATIGAHGGVWECPDLFPLKLQDKTYWVLLVNLNPGGPNKGSATQYFIGQFNGNKFTPVDNNTRWLDYGPDEYAGVTWSNTPNRRLFLGWMSNWLYATKVPTSTWRSATTLARELNLVTYNGSLFVASNPVSELSKLNAGGVVRGPLKINGEYDLSGKLAKPTGQYVVKLQTAKQQDFKIELSNTQHQKLIVGYDKAMNQYYIDRSTAGIADFTEGFARKYFAPRLSSNENIQLTLVVDKASVELFADGGATVMTCIFFPAEPLNKVSVLADKNLELKSLSLTGLNSIW